MQRKEADPRLRQLVLEQRVEALSAKEGKLVTDSREALFERRSKMGDMFKSVDLNNTGTVSLEEFLHALEGAGMPVGHGLDRARANVTEQDAARILSYFDRDGNGTLRYNEFMRLLQGTIDIAPTPSQGFRGSPDELSATGMLRQAVGIGRSGDDRDMQKIKDAFRSWDANSDGVISEREMSAVLKACNPGFTSAQVHKIFKAADANSDGIISWEEMINWLFKKK